jgi:hypothetical protein
MAALLMQSSAAQRFFALAMLNTTITETTHGTFSSPRRMDARLLR